VSLFFPTFGGGGAEVCMLGTARGLLERGLQVDLVVCRREGPLAARVPAGARVVELEPSWPLVGRACALAADPGGLAELLRPVLIPLKAPHRLMFLPALARYLRTNRPDALLAAMPTANLMAVWARRLARVPTRIGVSQRNTLSSIIGESAKWRKRFLPTLIRRVYGQADAIIAVSDGAAEDLARCTGIPRERIRTVYNPVVTPELMRKASEPMEHPWFEPGAPPVILGVGALIPQKDFPTLIRAFARLRARRPCRLMILGQDKTPEDTAARHAELHALADALGVADDLELPGFVENPFKYMINASLFVLSSRFEGLPGVLIQALACGCPAVSTDCPHGPAEILDGGRYGKLVPVGDDAALADAMAATLDAPPSASALRARAALFSVDSAVDRYLELLLGHAPQVPQPADWIRPSPGRQLDPPGSLATLRHHADHSLTAD
jgi:glycosyltransferase involved in cell wall biosynthesis